jgi:hypothetical protein
VAPLVGHGPGSPRIDGLPKLLTAQEMLVVSGCFRAGRGHVAASLVRMRQFARGVLVCILLVVAGIGASVASASQIKRTNKTCVGSWNAGLTPHVKAAVAKVHAVRAVVAVSAVYQASSTSRSGGLSCIVTLVGPNTVAMVLERGAPGRIQFDRVLPVVRGHRPPTNATVTPSGRLRLG